MYVLGIPRCELRWQQLMIHQLRSIVSFQNIQLQTLVSKPDPAPRMWTLSLICAFLGSATNLLFSLRYPSVAITPVIALVVVHPLGRLWDKLLKHPDDPLIIYEYGIRRSPLRSWDQNVRIPWKRTLRLWLGQGKWNQKEHACVYISSNVSFGFAFATDVYSSIRPQSWILLIAPSGNR